MPLTNHHLEYLIIWKSKPSKNKNHCFYHCGLSDHFIRLNTKGASDASSRISIGGNHHPNPSCRRWQNSSDYKLKNTNSCTKARNPKQWLRMQKLVDRQDEFCWNPPSCQRFIFPQMLVQGRRGSTQLHFWNMQQCTPKLQYAVNCTSCARAIVKSKFAHKTQYALIL